MALSLALGASCLIHRQTPNLGNMEQVRDRVPVSLDLVGCDRFSLTCTNCYLLIVLSVLGC